VVTYKLHIAELELQQLKTLIRIDFIPFEQNQFLLGFEMQLEVVLTLHLQLAVLSLKCRQLQTQMLVLLGLRVQLSFQLEHPAPQRCRFLDSSLVAIELGLKIGDVFAGKAIGLPQRLVLLCFSDEFVEFTALPNVGFPKFADLLV